MELCNIKMSSQGDTEPGFLQSWVRAAACLVGGWGRRVKVV